MRRIVELLVASVTISLMLNLMNAIDSGDTLEAISFVLGNISYRNIIQSKEVATIKNIRHISNIICFQF